MRGASEGIEVPNVTSAEEQVETQISEVKEIAQQGDRSEV